MGGWVCVGGWVGGGVSVCVCARARACSHTRYILIICVLFIFDTNCSYVCCSHICYILFNRIDGVMVIVLASSAVDREFEPRSG